MQAGRTAVMLAAESKAYDALTKLCKYDEGAINFVNKVFSLFRWIALILCTVFIYSQDGRTALMLSAESKAFDMVKFLIEKNANINHENKVKLSNLYVPHCIG